MMSVEFITDSTVVTVRQSGQLLELYSPAFSIEVRSGLLGGTLYEGPYEFTPTRSTQVAHTSSARLSGDIIVNPIPSNYGLITWDGTVITVS